MLHRPRPLAVRLLAVLVALLLSAAEARSALVSLTILKREPFAGGKAFGDTGPYEKIVGIARFAIDPNHARNGVIVDLDLAPRNADGKVEFEADVFLLAPKDPSKGNAAILYDVNNRGNKLALGFFNRGGGGNDPTTERDAGDGFLFRRGYTIVWCGWIGELLPGNNRMLLAPPVATDNGKPIRGLVRYEMVADGPAETMPLSRREGHGSYPPTTRGEATGVLTWRMRETDPRVVIPRGQWSLQRLPVSKVDKGVPGTLGQVRLRVAGGFRLGYIYELVCEAEGPIVQGTGFAAVRDLVSFLRHDTGKQNPLVANGMPAIKRAHGFGVSQSGRFLRHFLYLGFNADESGRKVFDGLIPHVAGGGLGFFNHRFAQPTRHNGQHEDHLYPADVFPFTYGDCTDPFSQRTDGILRRTATQDAKLLPKVMHTQSAAEYWHRSGSLVHTDPLGKKDADIPDNVRVYAFGGTQHGPAGDPPGRGLADNLLNPGDYRPFLRALLDALDAWVRDGTPPPDSVYPRIDKGTLAGWRQKDTRFPALPGVRYPDVIQRPSALDLGPDFLRRGISSIEPPRLVGDYVVLVPASDADGNDRGCLLPPEVGVPLATYTGWNLRRRDVGAEGMLASLAGSYIPFPRTAEERKASGDPRRAVTERYRTFEEYETRLGAYCQKLAGQRCLTQKDADRAVKAAGRARKLWGPSR
ncbi:MAG: hypothetical protein HYS12_24240 [Planctomycetes bacterium]|nr:hypothetical protein [Planctomycetota bacterium]